MHARSVLVGTVADALNERKQYLDLTLTALGAFRGKAYRLLRMELPEFHGAFSAFYP
jgi:hypothetical protein